jgi:GT2 family glycosyltransferase
VLLLLNNDTVVDRGMLAQLGAAFAADPQLAIAGPRICYWEDPSRIWYGGGELSLGIAHIAHRAIRASTTAGRDPAGPTAWVTGCALAVRADVWRAMNGLDEAFYIYGEDVDFCLRAQAAGARIVYVPTARLQHKVSASVGGHTSAFKVYHKARSTRLLLRRHATGVARWSAPAALVLREVALMAWLLAHWQWPAAAGQLAAWRDGVSGHNRFEVGA